MADDYSLPELDSEYKALSIRQLADRATDIATKQLLSSSEFKRPRLGQLDKYWTLYDGKVTKKLRQLFNVPIPVFAGMIDTLNAQYDTPIQLKFKEGDASDYFKVEKINAAFQMEVLNTAENSKWDPKLTMIRKHAIINGIGIPKLTAESDPEYKSTLEAVLLKHFHFQPKGGSSLENHLFAGEEDIEKTAAELMQGAKSGYYDKEQVKKLLQEGSKTDYLPEGGTDMAQKLDRFKPLGLNPDNHSYVGTTVFKLAQWILEIDGQRYFLVFHPWTKTWLRFEKWKDQCSSDLMPWRPYQTHEDSENMLSKSFADDLYPAADAIVAMYNQELTNREKRNFGARAYDKNIFTDVRKLDEAQYRPDALVPVDMKGKVMPIRDGIYQFETPELNGTVNLIDWTVASLGRNLGSNDMAQGSVEDASKKASVAFAEQKAISKRLSWGSQPFQSMMADLGKRYIYGLKDHMPSKMAVRIMGEQGWDWDEITRLDLSTTKDIDIQIIATDEKLQESEMRKEKRKEALLALAESPNINPKKRDEEILRSLGDYDDQEIAEFLDINTYSDKKSLAKASEAIQLIKTGKQPVLWHGATTAFMQKIVDFATDNQAKYPKEYELLLDYAMAHKDIVAQNLERKAAEQGRVMAQQQMAAGPQQQDPKKPASGIPAGVQGAMNAAELAL
jgi:hypothetical protein